MSFFKKKHKHINDRQLKAVLLHLDDYLDTHYTFRCDKKYQGWLGKWQALIDRDSEEEEEKLLSIERVWDDSNVFASDPDGLEWAIRLARENHIKNNFSSRLMNMIEERGLNAVSVYKRANIDRKLFSKIKTNKDYIPSKKTILALALAMELSLDETQELLAIAGFRLSQTILSDVIVEFFITHSRYDMDEINAALHSYDQAVF